MRSKKKAPFKVGKAGGRVTRASHSPPLLKVCPWSSHWIYASSKDAFKFFCPFQPFFSIFGLCGQTELSILVYLQLQKQFRWQIPTIPDLVELESKHVKAMVFFAPWSAVRCDPMVLNGSQSVSFGQCANETRISFLGFLVTMQLQPSIKIRNRRETSEKSLGTRDKWDKRFVSLFSILLSGFISRIPNVISTMSEYSKAQEIRFGWVMVGFR